MYGTASVHNQAYTVPLYHHMNMMQTSVSINGVARGQEQWYCHNVTRQRIQEVIRYLQQIFGNYRYSRVKSNSASSLLLLLFVLMPACPHTSRECKTGGQALSDVLCILIIILLTHFNAFRFVCLKEP
ncbi:hypothetical protein E2C01_042023 [Portunus trituberculatus]|uniref:Uncharacterized protein n=1 Tax=Portunus trituberculatus TaxID=210409 RepID=A0A5B7FRX1_PORTR|nr:hypothetical protein [Portunus trituberculatus]